MSAGTIFSTLLLDQSAWDLVLDAAGNIALAAPPYALAQDVASAVRTFLGELWYDTTQGLPYWTQILGRLPSSSLLIELINGVVLTVSGVVSSQTIITAFSPVTREVSGQIQFTDSSDQTTTVNF